MTDEQSLTTAPAPIPSPKKFAVVKELTNKISAQLRTLGSPYKKLIRVLLIVLGSLFALLVVLLAVSAIKNQQRVRSSLVFPSPTGAPTATPEANTTEEKLKILKDNIFKLDVYQGRLSPPTVKFDSAF